MTLAPTTQQIFRDKLRLVARFSWIATTYGVAIVVVMLGIGSLVTHHSMFTPALLRRFALPLLAYNGSLFFLALPYLVLRAVRERGQR